MKTKVLIWRANSSRGTAEDMLNNWLLANPNIKIISVTQSEAGDTAASHRITYTIWYEEVKK